MRTGTADRKDVLRERLQAIADKYPDLAPTARLYGAVLPVLRDQEPTVLPDGPSDDEVRERLEQGLPFLEGRELEIDAERLNGLLIRLAAAAEEAGAPVSAVQLARRINEVQVGDAHRAVQAIAVDDDGRPANDPERRRTSSDLCRFLAETALKTVMRPWAARLSALAADLKWDREYCLVCGSAALFAELQGNEQEKHLRCGLCGSDWRVARLSCPHCGNADHRSLKVFFQEDDHLKPSIEACDRCMTYVKVIPAFAPAPVDLLPVEDLATRSLDAVAASKGYRRGAGFL